MKRELKGCYQGRQGHEGKNSCSPNPYEEGTESLKRLIRWWGEMCCSPNPYEEGTERQIYFNDFFVVRTLQPKSL